MDTAEALFSEFGYHAVGVDRIIADSSVAKMTFYRNFKSKDNLIEKVLLRRDEKIRSSILEAMEKQSTPFEKLKSVFDWYEAWLNTESFHGCMFIKATDEFVIKESRIRIISREHKVWMVDTMRVLLEDIGVEEPDRMAPYLLVVLDGLTVRTNIFGPEQSVEMKHAWHCVKTLIDASIAIS